MNTCALRPPSVVLNRVSRQYTFQKKKKRLRGITPPPSHSTAATSSGPATPFYFGEAAKREHGEHSGSEICFNIPPPSLFSGGFFYIRIHRQILFSASSSKERHCRSGEKKTQQLSNG